MLTFIDWGGRLKSGQALKYKNWQQTQDTNKFLVISTDFDECQIPNACGVNYVCNNTIGSYRCECSTGFVAKCSSQNTLNPVCVGKN